MKAARSHLVRIGLIKDADILDEVVTRMEYAYPVIEKETEGKKTRIFRFLQGFENLKSSGRGALFEYIHIHDIMRISEEIMKGLALDGSRASFSLIRPFLAAPKNSSSIPCRFKVRNRLRM